jgi:photosystem II stability/assembly factor-like uncharacterized protein
MNKKSKHTRLVIFMAVILAFFTGSTFAQSNGWVQQTSGTNVILEDIQFIDANNGWAVGWDNTILKTTDGGQNWITKRSIVNGPWIYGVFFLDANKGWAAEDNGSILSTTDGGENWSETSTSAPYLIDFDFIDANNGWAFGGLGAILHTTDGGAHWASQNTNQSNDFYAGKFFNADTGVAVGYLGRCIKTTDGGASWSQKSTLLTDTFNDISFIDNKQGWAAGDFVIAHTTNGGDTWIKQKQLDDSLYLEGIFFTDSQNGWASGNSKSGAGIILHTTDGGTNWEQRNFYFNNFYNLKAFSFIDANTGWVVGDAGVILHTTNGGVTSVNEITGNEIPQQFVLKQNYPNPFNPSTTIEFSISKQSFVTLKVYDLLGREVTSLVNKELQSGSYKTQFNASNLASGVYLYRLNANGITQTRKLTVMK